MRSHREITRNVKLWPGDPDAPALPIHARLHYDPADPFAVRIAFPGPSGTEGITWHLSRALLFDGIDKAMGECDVRVEPAETDDWVTITLHPLIPEARMVLHAPRETLVTFLARTFVAVKMGSEASRIDWDAELAHLIGGAA